MADGDAEAGLGREDRARCEPVRSRERVEDGKALEEVVAGDADGRWGDGVGDARSEGDVLRVAEVKGTGAFVSQRRRVL